MTNYCMNLMEIEGAAADIAACRAICVSDDGDLDFNAIVAMPEILNGACLGVGDRMGWDAELGASALSRKQVQFSLIKETPILERQAVKEAGVQSFEELEDWLRKHRPDAIELGTRCLEAFRQTGYLTESDWKEANWGTHRYEHFVIAEETDTRLAGRLHTAWSPADRIYHEMARRFPGLKITVSAVEEGNELSYRFSAHNGKVEEEEPELTEEFMEYVYGDPLEVDVFYLKPAELTQAPMTHFRYWGAKRRVRKALAGYPVYQPPHEGIEMLMPEAHARANFEHFMAQREERRAALRRFLAGFGVPLEFSGKAKQALDGWLATYGAFLYVHETGSSYLSRMPAWEGERQGLNVIHDLAAFIGDFAIAESPGLFWEMYTDTPSGLQKQDDYFQKPAVGGFPGNARMRFYPLDRVHSFCRALRAETYMWRRQPETCRLPETFRGRFVSSVLHETHLMAREEIPAPAQ